MVMPPGFGEKSSYGLPMFCAPGCRPAITNSLIVTADELVFINVTVPLIVWPAYTVALSNVRGVTMLSTPMLPVEFTVIVTSLVLVSEPSVAVKRSTYDPAVEKLEG